MSEKFTASMGGVVVKHDSGELTFDCYAGDGCDAHHLDIGIGAVQALREFFEYERDKELGRWRHPQYPHFVVYEADVGKAFVIDERDGRRITALREDVLSFEPNGPLRGHYKAAWDFFDTHPELKPWHDAKPGEVWEITYRSPRGSEISNRVMTCVDDGGNISFFNEYRLHTVNYTGIESARRIWPEVDDDC